MIAATLWLLGMLGLPASAAEPFGFQLHPSSSVMIGMPMEIQGTATFPERYDLSPDLQQKTTGPFTILKIDLSRPAITSGTKTQPVKLTVVPFEIGTLTLPALDWTLKTASGSTQTIKSPPMKIEASAPATKPGEDEDIRDIRPPIGPAAWPLLILLAMAAALAFYGFREYRSRFKRKEGGTPEAVDTRPPHVIALEALERLSFKDLSPKEYYDQLSDIVRLYLERRFGIAAMVLTTTDLLRQMRQAEIERGATDDAKQLFDFCDLVKFAKLVPGEDEARRDQQAAMDLVRATAPLESACQQLS